MAPSRPSLAKDSAWKPSAPRLIALDWGTSSLRAYLLGDGGAVLQTRAEPWGIMQVPQGDFTAAFHEVTGAWRRQAPDVPAIASGMIGSAQGWVQAPYCECPTTVEDLAGRLTPVPEVKLHIVPGIAQGGDTPDVMRGEETQIAGALALMSDLEERARLVLPGTHSKWVRIEAGRIREFATYLTGELFDVLGTHSILGRFAREAGEPGDEAGQEAFSRGITDVLRSRHGAFPRLFAARALVLTGRLQAEDSLDYLSGLLIGEEVRCALEDGSKIALIGDAALCQRYVRALALFGVSGVPVIDAAAPAGLWLVASLAGLVGTGGEVSGTGADQ